jgi:hypothetical protein
VPDNAWEGHATDELITRALALDDDAGEPAAVGLSTCAAISGNQNLSLWLCRESSFGRCLSFDLRCVFTKPKPVVLAQLMVVSA